MTDLDQLSLDDIRQRLQRQPDVTYDLPPEVLKGETREAAVLIPFCRIDQAWHILYIRRAKFEGDLHSGQVAFAGGKRETGDPSLEHTALREAEEEIGLAHQDVKVLGYLNHHHTISEYLVRPYVAEVPWPYSLTLDEVEVAHAFTMPLTWLADQSNYRTEQRQIPNSHRPWPVVYYEHYEGELLWGATARMTLSLIEVLRADREPGEP
jgi:8-oxo-dGTP pyrophosphatase MutT (NUDIX family)